MSTGIEWCDETWNPTTGCTKVSPGCDHCYAEVMYERFNGKGSFATVKMHSSRLAIPFHWRKPRKVFVNSMSDLFHQDVTDFFIAEVFAVMALNPRHTFQILTKRHARMRSLLSTQEFRQRVWDALRARNREQIARVPGAHPAPGELAWPLPNVWLGVSVENQQWADIRIPALLGTPAAVRFLSCEPLLGPINLIGQGGDRVGAGVYALPDSPERDGDAPVCQDHGIEYCGQGCTFVDWVIVGGESGHGARPMHPDWARDLRDQCSAAGVAYLFKQHGEWREPLPGERYDTSKGRAGRPAAFLVAQSGTVHCFRETAGASAKPVIRVGKKSAGRELDGRTWDEYPTAVPA